MKTLIKKKFLVGMLSGALLFAGALGTYKACAAPLDSAQQVSEIETEQIRKHATKPHMKEMSETDINKFSKEIADCYGVSQSEVAQAFKDHKNVRDIKTAAIFAKLSGKSFKSVLDMKSDWWQVSEKLGITQDQVHAFFEQERAEEIGKNGELDTKIVNDLLKDGYNPFDIVMAGKIAKASNKNVKNVLAKRKINNTWEDVAKDFGVDFNSIKPKHFKNDAGFRHMPSKQVIRKNK